MDIDRLAEIAVGVVFVAAGIGKVASPLWPVHARGIGAPAVAVYVVPWLEIGVGALLVAGAVRPVPAVIAGALLVVFTGLLVRRLAQGQRPPCACFGGRRERPIGPLSVARNVGLLGLVAVALFA